MKTSTILVTILAALVAVPAWSQTVRIDKGGIDVVGADGQRVKVNAGGTTVESSGARDKKTPASTRTTTTTKDAKAPASGTRSNSTAPLMIAGADRELAEDCAGRDVYVSGSGHNVQLTGECASVFVSGADNVVRVEAAAAINVSGSDNKATWSRGIGGKPPKIAKSGFENQVEKQ